MSEPAKSTVSAEDEMVEPFWAALKESKIVIQKCDHCGYLRWPPGPVCPECQSRDSKWSEVAQEGTLVSYAVYHKALDPKFADEIPYVVGLIELADGPRMYANIVGDREKLVVDGRVRAVFPPVDENGEVRMVRWEMA